MMIIHQEIMTTVMMVKVMLVTTKIRKNPIPGTKYEFRVLAENRAGKSQPSETTLPQVVSVPMIMMIMMISGHGQSHRVYEDWLVIFIPWSGEVPESSPGHLQEINGGKEHQGIVNQ